MILLGEVSNFCLELLEKFQWRTAPDLDLGGPGAKIISGGPKRGRKKKEQQNFKKALSCLCTLPSLFSRVAYQGWATQTFFESLFLQISGKCIFSE